MGHAAPEYRVRLDETSPESSGLPEAATPETGIRHLFAAV
jgi:hypothetical protein